MNVNAYAGQFPVRAYPGLEGAQLTVIFRQWLHNPQTCPDRCPLLGSEDWTLTPNRNNESAYQHGNEAEAV